MQSFWAGLPISSCIHTFVSFIESVVGRIIKLQRYVVGAGFELPILAIVYTLRELISKDGR